MKKFLLSTLITCFAMSASANIIVDTQNVDQEKYQSDMYACQQYGQQVQHGETQSLGRDMLGSTAKGAALGAVGGAVAGGSGSNGAKVGAGIGLIGGALKHGAEKRELEAEYQQEQDRVVRQCMVGRGYEVLN